MQTHEKITASHLKRDAYLYVRQSTVRQVFENQESTKRQYALRQRAVAAGWPIERVIVIDDDLGVSAASTGGRKGFQRLVAEVGMGRAGIVLGLEVSRLARNSSDWHRLLEICALSQTLILDEDGIYDPGNFNDRLLLGLKGTMSEAELHVLRARLRGGILNKASRGELRMPLPVGLLHDANDRITLDPDKQVQSNLRHFFETFRRTGTARATINVLRDEKVLMPRRMRSGPKKGEVVWAGLSHWRALQFLHNPLYAGAYVFGRHRVRKLADGRTRNEVLPQDQWHTLLLDAHEGYISWEEYQANQRQLLENARSHGKERRRSPPREGPALLQGIVMCGKCGQRMTIRYHQRVSGLQPNYVCQRDGINRGGPICESIPGEAVDTAVGNILVEMMTPIALEVALGVQQELVSRFEEADRLRRKQVERAQYEADLARRRLMQVDPENRLVADSLEAEWNERLRILAKEREDYEHKKTVDSQSLDAKTREEVIGIASDFPKLWNDPATPPRDRKRMMRLLVEDVTLVRKESITVHVRFRGCTTRSLSLPLPTRIKDLRRTSDEAVQAIKELLDEHVEVEIAGILNARGFRTGAGREFTKQAVHRLRRAHDLASRYDRLRRSGMLTLEEIAKQLSVTPTTIKIWNRHGLLEAVPYNDKNQCLYARTGDCPPAKQMGTKLTERRRFPEVASERSNEV